MSDPIVRIGFFGKLPSRGDFIRVSLSRAFTDAWDQWLQSVMPEAQRRLDEQWGEIWHPTWAWRFAFEPGICGPLAVSGLWLPSTDRVERSFPLMIAAEAAEADEAFLEAAERIGAEAIRDAADPETLANHLGLVPRPSPAAPGSQATPIRWWRGAETDDTNIMRSDILPDTDTFIQMLTA